MFPLAIQLNIFRINFIYVYYKEKIEMIILNFIRVLLLLVLFTFILFEIEIPIILHTPTNQLIIAIVILFIIIIIDEISGFILGVIFLVVYFKHYQKLKSNKSELQQPLITNKPNFIENDTFIDDIKPAPYSKIEQFNSITDTDNKDYDNKNNCITMPYISQELLDKAQSNVYNENNYNIDFTNTKEQYGVDASSPSSFTSVYMSLY
jgi:hypothetical protein